MKPAAVPVRHLLLAVAVVAVWGSNFVVIKYALADLSPLLFAALRFALAAFPAVFFFKKPAVPWRNLVAYGWLIGVGQFGLLYLAMRSDISPGLASLVVQSQVFFTLGLSMWMTGERVQSYQWVALLLAASGIVTIAMHTDGSTTPLGLLMVLGAALSWAGGNTVSRAAGQVDMLSYVVWSSACAAPVLGLLSWMVEGDTAIMQGLHQASWGAWAAVLWQSLGNTLFGYGVWAWLLSRHSAGSIAPMALLVPVFGMSASAWLLAEPLPSWKLWAAALVLLGLGLNVVWPRLKHRF